MQLAQALPTILCVSIMDACIAIQMEEGALNGGDRHPVTPVMGQVDEGMHQRRPGIFIIIFVAWLAFDVFRHITISP